ncbi:unnamed protein product [Aphanomyces euteiches]|uniref:sphinganine-1-phosphate aldolase n=1 Tax=Aphanomyces euteiches TaxID=100861 RepID=A0A6G0XVT3_9STRA|nr:hypothetical protein Ae201684_001069 [Aphanomyces euteiches]KAH9099663.1 hypothetical protein Ae201684P_018676 [Aphanomyces euteiches]KAH9143411.1 hypothetical protein AeRB84_012588 [Aphanomyces euteiches]
MDTLIQPNILSAVAAGAFAVYVTLGQFTHVDRLFAKVFPLAALAFLAFRALEQEKRHQSLLDLVLNAGSKYAPLATLLAGDALVLFALFQAYTAILSALRRARYGFSKKKTLNVVGQVAISIIQRLPILSSTYRKEIQKIQVDIETSLKEHAKSEAEFPKNFALPEEGQSPEAIIKTMQAMVKGEDDRWKDGLVSGAVYHGEQEHVDLLNKAYGLFNVTNPLHADLWPSVVRMEAEVVSMTASFLNGGNTGVCGAISSGGTESIILATKTHRDWFRAEHGITKPEIIAAVTAHAAIDKACDVLGIRLIKVPVDPVTFKVDVAAVKWNITANTIMIYSSAPNFPQGTIDDITALSKLATTYGIGLHVDCCLGGFVLPFAKALGYPIPEFDFSLPGVTSMSCDTHKYGYASKGTSVVLYKSKEIRRYQYFAYSDWTGGLYATPTFAGSRPGALSAACWASMIRMGRKGYLEKTRGIMETVAEIKAGIQSIDGLYLLGDTPAMVICFGSKEFNVLKVSDHLTKAGWSLNALQHPTSVHLCVTCRQIGKGAELVKVLREAVAVVKKDPNGKLEGGSAMYGMASSMPAGPVEDILRIYQDCTLSL